MKHPSLLLPKILAPALGLILTSAGFSKKKNEHLIGPTGIMAEADRNQIQVIAVDEGSPAAGKLKKGDVIVGAGDGKFSKDVRGEFAAAIEKAEGVDLGGKLTLTLKGSAKAELQLKELGSFSKTAPWDCPKTNAIITRAAEKMVETGDFKNDGVVVGWIGLLSTASGSTTTRHHGPPNTWARSASATEFITTTLKLHRLENHDAKPMEEFYLSKSTGRGALYQVMIAGDSTNLRYLEACMRAYMGKDPKPLILSSGLEDYFLGTYYFDTGKFHADIAGLTHFDK